MIVDGYLDDFERDYWRNWSWVNTHFRILRRGIAKRIGELTMSNQFGIHNDGRALTHLWYDSV